MNDVNNNKIEAGQVLTARSACDSACIFSAAIISRSGGFATVKAQGNVRRVKIFTGPEGEYVYALGRHSMAPIFRAK